MTIMHKESAIHKFMQGWCPWCLGTWCVEDSLLYRAFRETSNYEPKKAAMSNAYHNLSHSWHCPRTRGGTDAHEHRGTLLERGAVNKKVAHPELDFSRTCDVPTVYAGSVGEKTGIVLRFQE